MSFDPRAGSSNSLLSSSAAFLYDVGLTCRRSSYINSWIAFEAQPLTPSLFSSLLQPPSPSLSFEPHTPSTPPPPIPIFHPTRTRIRRLADLVCAIFTAIGPTGLCRAFCKLAVRFRRARRFWLIFSSTSTRARHPDRQTRFVCPQFYKICSQTQQS